MKLIENETKFAHKSMPSWGVGIFRESDGTYITIDFENAGIKKFGMNSIGTTLMVVEEKAEKVVAEFKPIAQTTYVPVNAQNGALIQYDGESGSIAGKNIIEAFEGNDSVIFNESYIIIGEHTEALKIHAMYDLTIMGDVTAQECVVNGSLTVIGNARIKNITCQNGFICKGDLHSEKVYVGEDLIADSVVCDELICDGNAAIQTTANINQVAQIAKTIVACEGIMGAGKFTAQNTIANEYFEFDGHYEGKILELETDETICDTVPQNSDSYDTVEDVIALANKKLTEEYGKCSSLDEKQLIDHLRFLSGIEDKELKALPIVEPLFSKLADLSYKSRIETIEEYLTVLVAKELLPDEVFSYESIEHIGRLYLSKAHDEINNLIFEPTTIEQFAQVLSMAVKFEEELSDDWEIMMDMIFESVGLKYSTVSSMIRRNKPKETETSVPADFLPASSDGTKDDAPKTDATRMKKSDFLAKKLSHGGKKFGLTDVELERMATIKIRTFDDLINASDETLTKVFGKKAFLADHLIQTRDKIIEKLVDME